MVVTRDECRAKSVEWVERAEQAMTGKVNVAMAANVYAGPQVAASLAIAYATLALSAED